MLAKIRFPDMGPTRTNTVLWQKTIRAESEVSLDTTQKWEALARWVARTPSCRAPPEG